MIAIKIYNGLAWVRLNCDTSKLKDVTERTDGELYGRLKFSGTITVYKDSYDLLDTIVTTVGTLLELQIYLNGEMFLATMSSEQNNNVDFKYKDLQVVLTDAYSNFDKYGNTDYNYLNATENSESIAIYDADPPTGVQNFETITETVENTHTGLVLNYSSGKYLFNMGHGAISEPTFDIPTLGATFSLLSAYYKIVNFSVNSETVGVTMNADLIIRTTIKKCRESSIGTYIFPFIPNPPAGSGWVFKEDVYNDQGNKSYPVYVRPIPSMAWANTAQSDATYENGDVSIELSECVGTGSGTVNSMLPEGHSYSFPRWRFLKDVIEYIVGEVDSTIAFDSTGTETDSFYFLNSYVSDSWKYDVTGTIYPNTAYATALKYQVLIPLPNAIVDERGAEKSNAQTVANTSFNAIISELKRDGYRWYLDNRSGTYYFILTHKLIAGNELSTINLNNHQGNNFTDLNLNINYEEPEFNTIHNSSQGSGFEFVGTDSIFEKVNIDNVSEYQSAFHRDINDVRIGANYDNESLTESVLLACQPYLTTTGSSAYIVRFPNGSATNAPINNAELSYSYVAENLISELPDSIANVNGSDIIIVEKRLKKRKSIKIDFSTKQISDIEFDKDLLFRYFRAGVKGFSVTDNSLELSIGELIGPYYYTQFDGVNEYVDCGNDTSLSFEVTDSFSGSAWIKSDEFRGTVLSKRYTGSPNNTGYDMLITPSGNVRFVIIGGSSSNLLHIESVTQLTLNKWHCVSFTYDGALGAKLFIDGVQSSVTLLANTLNLSAVITNNASFRIGVRSNNVIITAFFNGNIDEVSVYGYELTPTQILNVYTLDRKNPDLSAYSPISHWRMDDINPIDEEGINDGTGVNLDPSNIIRWN